MIDNMSSSGHGNKGDANTRVDPKKYKDNLAKVKKVRETRTSGFKFRVNGVEQ